MAKIKFWFFYFTKFERILWSVSMAAILLSYFLFDRSSVLTLIASIIGVTFLTFCAKGNPIGQALTIIFSILYGIISLSYAYYGEMITYFFMTAPMAAISLVTWIKHPYDGNRSQVEVHTLQKKEIAVMVGLTAVVTAAFYFLLRAFHTANLVPSTVSVATSFLAMFLTSRRSPFFALAYAANDLVLIILWALASAKDRGYLSVLVCFTVFLFNDIYGFISWSKMQKNQRVKAPSPY